MSRLALSDLLPNTQYAIQVRSTSKDGRVSEWSPRVTFTTINDTVPPATPTGVTWTPQGNSFHAEWNSVTTNANGEQLNVAFYDVALTVGGTTKNVTVTPSSIGNKVTFDLSFEQNLALFGTPAATVQFKVRAVDGRDLVSAYTSPVSATNPSPATPTAPAVGSVATAAADAISLAWTAVPDTDIVGYNIYTGSTVGFTASPTNRIYSGLSTRFTYTTTTYSPQFFKIRAIDVFGQESGDLTGNATPTSPFVSDSVPPVAPNWNDWDLAPNANGIGAVAYLNWYAGVDVDNNVDTDLAGFEIQYKPTGEFNWRAGGTYPANDDSDLSYITNLSIEKAHTDYEFRVRAFDGYLNYSDWVQMYAYGYPDESPTTPTGLTAKPGKDSITYNWTAVSDSDLSYYEATFSTSSTFASGNTTFKTGTSANLTVSGLSPSTTYYMRVRAVDVGGLQGSFTPTNTSATTSFPTTPLTDGLAPQSSPTPNVSSGLGYLYATWAPVTLNSSGGAQQDPVTYEVHLSTTTGFTATLGGATKVTEVSGTFALIDILPGTTTPLSYGTTYYVKLIAKDRDGAAAAGAEGFAQIAKVAGSDSTITPGDIGAPTNAQFSTAVKTYVTEYAVNASETIAPTTGWSTSTPTRTPGTFIWYRVVVTYQDNSTTTSAAALLTGNAGATGSAGTPGVGISSTAVTYQVGGSGTTAPVGTWVSSPPATTPGTFLWTRTVTTYTNSTTTTAYSVSAHGTTGSAGTNGVGVSSTTVTYQVGSSGTTAPVGTWQSTPQATATGQFLWTRTITTYTDASTSTAYSVSAHGATGGTGATGTSVNSIITYYAQVTTGSLAPDPPVTSTPSAPWTSTEPGYVVNTELYRTDRIGFSNGSYSYTTVSKSSAYTAAVTAVTAANGKNKSTYSPYAPTATDAGATGDIWFVRAVAVGSPITAQYESTGGTAGAYTWVQRRLDDTTIANLNVGKLVTGDISGQTFRLTTGGYIKSSTYDSSGGATGFMLYDNGLIIKSGSVDANLLTANTTITQNLGVTGTLTVGSGGAIQSSNYNGTTLGYQITTSGITMLDSNSKISAAALQGGTISATSQIVLGPNANLIVNGGYIQSNTYSAGSAGFRIGTNGIEMNDSNSQISAAALKTSTLSAVTITIPTTGSIQSSNFSTGIAGNGWKLSTAGLEINQGIVRAKAIIAQNGNNMIDPIYADFEMSASTYPSLVNTLNSTASVLTTSGGKFGSQYLNLVHNGVGAQFYVLLSPTSTTYNTNVNYEPVFPTTLIVSAYVRNRGTVDVSVRPVVKWSNGTLRTTAALTSISASGVWQRISGTYTTETGTAIFGFQSNTTGAGNQFDIDGVQVEVQNTADTAPSAWAAPGTTTINGGMVKTGALQSTTNVTINSVTYPTWSLDLGGNIVLNNALIRGNTVLGSTLSETTSMISSFNYSAGANGWRITAAGAAEFQQATITGAINATSGTFSGTITASGTISGGTFTGGTFQTAPSVGTSVPGVKFDSSGIRAYGGGIETIAITNAGTITLSGTLSAVGTNGAIIGATYKTATTGQRIEINTNIAANTINLYSGSSVETLPGKLLSSSVTAGGYFSGSVSLRSPAVLNADNTTTRFAQIDVGASRSSSPDSGANQSRDSISMASDYIGWNSHNGGQSFSFNSSGNINSGANMVISGIYGSGVNWLISSLRTWHQGAFFTNNPRAGYVGYTAQSIPNSVTPSIMTGNLDFTTGDITAAFSSSPSITITTAGLYQVSIECGTQTPAANTRFIARVESYAGAAPALGAGSMLTGFETVIVPGFYARQVATATVKLQPGTVIRPIIFSIGSAIALDGLGQRFTVRLVDWENGQGSI